MQPSQQEVSSAICGFTASLRLSISSLEAHHGSAQQGWHRCPDVQSRCATRATCPSILCRMAGACFSAFPCSPPTSVPLGKAGLGASMGGTGGREVRRDGGKGATALRAGQLRGTAAPQCHPLQPFPIALCCAGGWQRKGRRPLTPLGKMQWRWHSAPCSHLPAGQWEPGTAQVHVCWSLELLLTSGWVSPWLRAMSDGAAACHYHHSGYDHHLLLFSSTERHDHRKY